MPRSALNPSQKLALSLVALFAPTIVIAGCIFAPGPQDLKEAYPEVSRIHEDLMTCSFEQTRLTDACLDRISRNPTRQAHLRGFYDCLLRQDAEGIDQLVCYETLATLLETAYPEPDASPGYPAAEAEDASNAATNEVASATADTGGDIAAFCTIYEEMVAEVVRGVDEYEAATAADEPAHHLAVEVDLTVDDYYERLADSPPRQISGAVGTVAAASVVGLMSSEEGLPDLEPLIEEVDSFATDNCATSLEKAG